MRPDRHLIAAGAVLSFAAVSGCGQAPAGLDVLTQFSLVNLSTRFYAALAIREHRTDGAAAFSKTPLVPPGAVFRADFLDFVGRGCPGSLDLQMFLYRRVDNDVPIGLDQDEAVEALPIAAGQVLDVPACSVEPVVTYTIVNWEAAEGTARVKIAQGSDIEAAIRRAEFFPNVDAAWEINGVEPELSLPPPDLMGFEPLAGRVARPDGSGVEGVGVLVRTRFRVRLDDDDPTNDPDVGFGGPIAFTTTDADGSFAFERPPGAYRVEVFADGLLFRPAVIDVESPIEVIQVIAEPM